MSYEFYTNYPMEEVELKLNMIIAKNPNSINSLDRNISHPLIIKYNSNPFKIQQIIFVNTTNK